MEDTMDPDEPEVRSHDAMPKGYSFVPKGNVYITKNCRKKTHEAEKTLYVVVDKTGKPMGMRCPTYIHKAVMSEDKATASQRAQAVQKRDTAIEENFEEAIVKLFPEIPKTSIPQIIKHALKKHSRRVGRAGTVDLQARVKLAVRAHIRHIHTDYDLLLKQGASKSVARDKVWEKLNEVARRWGGRPLKPAAAVSVEGRRGKKTKAAAPAGKKTKTKVAAKKVVVHTAQRTTRRMSREALELSLPTFLPAPQANSGQAGLRVRTRRMTSELAEAETEDIPMVEELGADVNGFLEDVDARDAVFTRGEETSDYDSDGSEWSNWSDVRPKKWVG
jgi:hypothetical protein